MNGGVRPAPVVSIVTPLYNSAPFIERALESVLAQTCAAWEHILVDDGSPDDTSTTVRPYLHDERVVYLSQPNAGIGAARNTGIRAARGTWIALLDHDDSWFPHKLETQLAVAARRDAEIVCSDAVVTRGADSFRYSEWFFPRALVAGLAASASEDVDFLELLLEANFVCASSVMIRRGVFERYGLLDPAAAPSDDYDMWLRCMPDTRIAYVEEPLVEYALHDTNYSHDRVRLHTKTIETLERHARRFDGDPLRRAQFERALSHFRRIVYQLLLAEGALFRATVHAVRSGMVRTAWRDVARLLRARVRLRTRLRALAQR